MPSNETEPIDTALVAQSLQKIAKGAGIVFIGNAAGMLLAFIGRLLVARYCTPMEYGLFSLGYTIVLVCLTIGTLGLEDGVARQIAYYKEKRNNNENIFLSK